MFMFPLRADKETKKLSPENIVDAIEFHGNSKKLFRSHGSKVCLMSSEDHHSYQVDTSR